VARCECALCGLEFSGLGSFDKHQDVDYGRRPAVVCLDPADVGLTLLESRRCWGTPASERLRALRAEQGGVGVIARGEGSVASESVRHDLLRRIAVDLRRLAEDRELDESLAWQLAWQQAEDADGY